MHDILKKFMRENNISIRSLSSTLGVSFSYMSKIYYGERKPSASFIQKFKTTYPAFDANIFFSQ